MTNLNICEYRDTEIIKIYYPVVYAVSLVLVTLSVKVHSVQYCVLQHFVP